MLVIFEGKLLLSLGRGQERGRVHKGIEIELNNWKKLVYMWRVVLPI